MHTATLVSCLLIATATLPCQAATCGALLSPMAFGIYDSILPAANDTVATVTVSCTPGVSQPLTTSYTITIAGTGTGNDAVRAMSSIHARRGVDGTPAPRDPPRSLGGDGHAGWCHA